MKNILIIDIETTGFSHSKDKIVEVGIIELDLNTGIRKIIFDEMIKENGITEEEIEISWIVKNDYIKKSEILEAVNFDVHKEGIQNIVNNYKLGTTAYNNRFDFGFLENRGIIIENKLSCPMLLSTDICKLPGRYSSYKWPTVEEAYKHFFPKSEYIEKHRGADDAMHEAEIVYELYKLGIFKI